MPLIIPVFIPHQGCPHACIFCNQYRISGQRSGAPVSPAHVQKTVQLWLERSHSGVEGGVQVAFYGGSFTGLPAARQKELLEAVEPFLNNGRVKSIRLSTRPDYVGPETVAFLRAYGVSTVELGVQSLDDRVLEASCRGHKAEDVYRAVDLLRRGGMRIGLQLMLGLPLQSGRSARQTAREAAALEPDFVRIYPVLVLRQSRLGELYARGAFRPLSLDKAVAQAAWMKKYFDAREIRVVRMGLQPGPELEQSLVAGPYHPAFGEMVRARIMFQKTRKLLQGSEHTGPVVLSVSPRDASIFRGVGSRNMKRFTELGLAGRFVLTTDSSQPRATIRIGTTTLMNQTAHAQRQ